jgi:hypothetical protein
MAKKLNRKKLRKGQVELKPTKQSAGPESQPPVVEAKPEPPHLTTELEYAPPEMVAEAARGEANPRLVEDYVEAIGILRDEKRFTFREIAEWLKDRFGIEADHNAVYRAYTKGMPDMDAAIAARDEEEDERNAAQS